jgi:hypothetical protein
MSPFGTLSLSHLPPTTTLLHPSQIIGLNSCQLAPLRINRQPLMKACLASLLTSTQELLYAIKVESIASLLTLNLSDIFIKLYIALGFPAGRSNLPMLRSSFHVF